MKNIKVGFTGTQKGMIDIQKKLLVLVLDNLMKTYKIESVHHGDCIGADEQFHYYAKYYELKTVLHPPINPTKRAFCKADEQFPPEDYLERNRNIVNNVDIMIATPAENEEVLRSGTWSTIRYTKKNKKTLIIIFPNGEVSYE